MGRVLRRAPPATALEVVPRKLRRFTAASVCGGFESFMLISMR
jgi:hypothetical protein